MSLVDALNRWAEGKDKPRRHVDQVRVVGPQEFRALMGQVDGRRRFKVEGCPACGSSWWGEIIRMSDGVVIGHKCADCNHEET